MTHRLSRATTPEVIVDARKRERDAPARVCRVGVRAVPTSRVTAARAP